MPPLLGLTTHEQEVTGDLVEAEIYAMLALGLNVVVGFAGLLDLGYAAFFAIGAYVFGLIGSAHFQPSSQFSSPLISWGSNGIHANFWFFLPLCALVAALFGVVLGAPTLRLRGDYLAIVTLGFGEIVHKTVINLGPSNAFGWPDITGGDNSLSGIFQPQIASLQFSTDQVPWYYLGLIVLTLVIMIAYSLQNSRLGRAWVAMREDELAATLHGDQPHPHQAAGVLHGRLLLRLRRGCAGQPPLAGQPGAVHLHHLDLHPGDGGTGRARQRAGGGTRRRV